MRPGRARVAALVFTIGLVACAVPQQGETDEVAEQPLPTMNAASERYIQLVLAVGRHDSDYVDAYYGPDEWRNAADRQELTLEEIRSGARGTLDELAGLAPDGSDELVTLRRAYLTTQLRSLIARTEMLDGKVMSFDEESRALYDAVAPTHSEEYFQAILDELEPLLPGEGTLGERYDAFRLEYVIPTDKLDVVFRAAIEACRERTSEFLELPAGESFEVEYVTGKSWSAYNWYQGGFHSLIQVNTDLPIYIDRAIDLACHEGYPGHHVYNVLLEKHLVRDRGWNEFSVYPLFSPQSLIAEGTANYGIRVAFPGTARAEFEKRTLFPLAGLDPRTADRFQQVLERIEKLDFAGNEVARDYLNGTIDAETATDRLTRYSLMPRARAQQRLRFIEQYRSYVINYNLGQELVREYIESRCGAAADREKIWEEFGRLISSPRLPSGLGTTAD